jgi:uncharacterized protein (DUF1778 family)
MTPPKEKSATLNFRVDEHVPEMLKQLAELAGMSMTDYVTTFIRATYRAQFPDRANAFETPAERFARQIMSTTATTPDRKRGKR